VPAGAVKAVRAFNRFYTRRIGVLADHLLDSPFTLAEMRVLYELAHRSEATATELGRELGLDAGYLSRILRRFQQQGLIRKETSPSDARRSELTLTAKGRQAFAPLEARRNSDVGQLLSSLTPETQQTLLAAMQTIEGALRPDEKAGKDFILRDPRPGDLGWVVSRHATFYREHYGWREPFEAMCAQIVADFANNNDPRREHCWIAERGGQTVGSIILVRETDDIARIRLLLVDPAAQGLGIGSALVDACIAFARQAGYRRITLWTHQVLAPARRLYESRGFTLTGSEPHASWGVPVVGETWDLDL